MANPKPLRSAQIKGGKTTGPRKAGFMREQLEKYVFESDKVFKLWVQENFTDAVKELGKLQPKNLTVGGDDENPLITKVVISHVGTNSKPTGEDS